MEILSAFWRPFSRWTWASRYQNVSILDLIRAKCDVDSGNNWSYKTCKDPVEMSPPTNRHPVFYGSDALPVTQTTVSKHRREFLCSGHYSINVNWIPRRRHRLSCHFWPFLVFTSKCGLFLETIYEHNW